MRWSVEQVEAVASSPAAVTAAQAIASPTNWRSTGADDRGVWGSCRGSGAEPYDTMVDHVTVGFRCTCPSRRVPCKHALALLLLWARGQVADAEPPPTTESWLIRRQTKAASRADAPDRASSAGADDTTDGRSPPVAEDRDAAGADRASTDTRVAAATGGAVATGAADPATAGSPTDAPRSPGDAPESPPTGRGAAGASSDAPDPAAGGADTDAPPPPPPDGERDTARDERVARMLAGLTELDRWLDDRIRTGLADPALARYATWDSLAARLVDAQAGSLANRVRRLAGLVGASPDWHDDVLAELGILHLLTQAGRRLPSLPDPLADDAATAVGWQVRQADVLAGVPDTDDWIVAGRSDTREDRIEVRRHWLRGASSGRWAMVLSFAAYRQSLDDSLRVGTALPADLHRYPGGGLRSLVGQRLGDPAPARPPAGTIAEACDEIGRALADVPWIDRLPATVTASLAVDDGQWALTDHTGSLPLLGSAGGLAAVLAASAGEPVDLTIEWTPHGVVALTVHLPDRTVDIGPRADPSFVSAA